MKNLLVVDATLYFDRRTAELSAAPLASGTDALSSLRGRLARISPVDNILVLCLAEDLSLMRDRFGGLSAEFETTARPADLQVLLGLLGDLAKKREAENLTLCYADSPVLDPAVCTSILKTHLENAAEYSFPDNLPDGIGCEAMSKDFLDGIAAFPARKPELLSRRVFDNLKADINQFYAEVWLPEEDISLKRLEFHTNTRRNFSLLQALLGHVPDPGFDGIVKAIADHPAILRSAPRFVECEITTLNNERMPLIPAETFKRGGLTMDPALFDRIVGGLTAAADDVILSFGGHGEPLCHPGFAGLLERACGPAGVFSALIETNGLLFGPDLARQVTALPPSKCQVIFRLDAARPATCTNLKGSDLAVATANIDRFLGLDPLNRHRTFVQFTKLPENIDELEDFYRAWDAKGVGVVIMKYNDFGGQLPDRKVSDLTPLDRLPCWHLQRDLVVFADGSVPVCKQDFNALNPVANLAAESAAQAWEKLKPFYLSNYAGRFEAWPPCGRCDEWYTYNF